MMKDRNAVQPNDMMNTFKELIGDLSYQVAYRDGVIKALERIIEDKDEEIQELERRILTLEENK